MFNLLKNLHDQAETIKGRKLAVYLVIIFITFTFIGFAFNYFTKTLLNSNETPQDPTGIPMRKTEIVSRSGVITRLNTIDLVTEPPIPQYALTDPITGTQIILLRADDQKLQALEGNFATVSGRMSSFDGEELLIVDSISLKQ